MNLNKVIIIGRMATDPEIRSTQTGQQVASVRVATNRVWTNNTGQKQEQVEFHNVVAWGRLADIMSQYLKKGSLVMLEGRLQTRSWTGQDNVKRYSTEIVVENLQMGPRSSGETSPYNSGNNTTSAKTTKPASPLQSNKTEEDNEIPVINQDEPIISDDEIEEKEINIEDIPF